MRFIFPLILVLLFASCKKTTESYPYKATYQYLNTSGHYVQIAIYQSRSSTQDSVFVLRSGGGIEMDYARGGSLPTPFFYQQPDSVEVVFDSSKRIVYTLSGDNGFAKSRNLLNMGDNAYARDDQAPRVVVLQYSITAGDYANAR